MGDGCMFHVNLPRCTRNHHQKRFKRATKNGIFPRVPKPSEKRSGMMFIHRLRPHFFAVKKLRRNLTFFLTSWWFEWKKVQQIWKWSDIYIYTYISYLVGGFKVSTHLKNMLVKMDHVPRLTGWKLKIFELPPPSLRLEVLMSVKELKVCFPV